MGLELRSTYMKACFVIESVNFERGLDPRKAMEVGIVRPYPQMSPEEFGAWFEREILPYIDGDDYEAMVDNLFMNDWEDDHEVEKYLVDRGMERGLVRELLPMRDYFNDNDHLTEVYRVWKGEHTL